MLPQDARRKQRAGDVDSDMLAGNSWAMQQSHDGAGSCQ